MAETYTVEAKLIADINDYSSKLSQAAKQMSGFSKDTEGANKKPVQVLEILSRVHLLVELRLKLLARH